MGVIIVYLIILLVIIAFVIYLFLKTEALSRELQKTLIKLTMYEQEKNVSAVLKNVKESMETILNKAEKLDLTLQKLEAIHKPHRIFLQHYKTADKDLSSFSLIILGDKDDGILITCIQPDIKIYAKEILRGKCLTELTPSEEEFLSRVLNE